MSQTVKVFNMYLFPVLTAVLDLLKDGLSDENQEYLDNQISLPRDLIPEDLVESEQRLLDEAKNEAFRTSSLVTRCSREFKNARDALKNDAGHQ